LNKFVSRGRSRETQSARRKARSKIGRCQSSLGAAVDRDRLAIASSAMRSREGGITMLIQDGSRSGIRSPRGVRDSLELGLTFRRFISRVGLGMLRHLSARLSESRKDMQAVERRIPFGSIVVSEHPLSENCVNRGVAILRPLLNSLTVSFPRISTFMLLNSSDSLSLSMIYRRSHVEARHARGIDASNAMHRTI
jgi:hypothetical protein